MGSLLSSTQEEIDLSEYLNKLDRSSTDTGLSSGTLDLFRR